MATLIPSAHRETGQFIDKTMEMAHTILNDPEVQGAFPTWANNNLREIDNMIPVFPKRGVITVPKAARVNDELTPLVIMNVNEEVTLGPTFARATKGQRAIIQDELVELQTAPNMAFPEIERQWNEDRKTKVLNDQLSGFVVSRSAIIGVRDVDTGERFRRYIEARPLIGLRYNRSEWGITKGALRLMHESVHVEQTKRAPVRLNDTLDQLKASATSREIEAYTRTGSLAMAAYLDSTNQKLHQNKDLIGTDYLTALAWHNERRSKGDFETTKLSWEPTEAVLQQMQKLTIQNIHATEPR